MAAAAILDFWNREILLTTGVQRVKSHQHAKFRKNRSVGCEDIKIFRSFKIAAAAILDCQILHNFIGWQYLEGPDASLYQISSKSVVLLRFFEFSKWPPPLSWIFEIAKFYWLLGCRGSRRISVPNFVKISQLFAKILRFYDFSRWRPSAILDLFMAYMDHPQSVLGRFYPSAKFRDDQCSSFYNMNISIFGAFGWKMHIHAPNIVFLGNLIP